MCDYSTDEKLERIAEVYIYTTIRRYCFCIIRSLGFLDLAIRFLFQHSDDLFAVSFLLSPVVLLHLRTFLKNFVCAQFSFAHINVYHLRTVLVLHLRACFCTSS